MSGITQPRRSGTSLGAGTPLLSIFAAGVRHGVTTLADLPIVQSVRRAIHRADFIAGRSTDTFSGCYASVAEAAAAAPSGRIGYDHDAMTGFYTAVADASKPAMDSSDYAVLFWLKGAMHDGCRVFDLGGYVGSAYYNFGRYLAYPPDLSWTVCDVPAVVRAGRELAQRNGTTQLQFTLDRGDADGADILLAAGSLQYLEEGSLHRLLHSLHTRPKHVIVQRTPLHADNSFVTLQVMVPPGGPFFCPYTVANRQAFIDDLCSLGYELIDSWTKPRELVVPLHPRCRVPAYSGLYFRALSQ